MPNRFLRAVNLEPSDGVPFVPAVYEHKAWFIGRTPSEVCREGSLLVESVLAEYEALHPDALVVGIDVLQRGGGGLRMPRDVFRTAGFVKSRHWRPARRSSRKRGVPARSSSRILRMREGCP